MKETRDSIAEVWGERTPYAGKWPQRVDELTIEEPDEWVQSACLLCSNGCGCDIGVKNGKIVGVRGRARDRVNHGRLGPKGLYGWQANNSPDRLTHPLLRSGDKFREASGDEAMDLIVERSKELISKHTSNAIGFTPAGNFSLRNITRSALSVRAGLARRTWTATRVCVRQQPRKL